MKALYRARLADAAYLQAEHSPAYGFGTGDFTVVAMIAARRTGTLVAKWDVNARHAGFQLALAGEGRLDFYLTDGSSVARVTSGVHYDYGLLDGQCHTVAGVRRGQQLFLLVDGRFITADSSGTARDPVDVSNTVPLTIGAAPPAVDLQFLGSIMNVSVWNVALDAEGVQRAMYRTVAATDPGLQGFWTLDRTAEDLSNNRNPLRLVGPVAYEHCIDCVWAEGPGHYKLVRMTNGPPEAGDRAAEARLSMRRSLVVEVGTPSLCMSVMADQDAPTFPSGATVTVTDPGGKTYHTDQNTQDLFVTTAGGQPWALLVIGPAPGRWTVKMSLPASLACALQLQTIPAKDVVGGSQKALAPLYGQHSARALTDRPAIRGLSGFWNTLTMVAVATLTGVAVAGVVALTGGAALPAVVAGLVAFTGVGLAEAQSVLNTTGTGSLNTTGQQFAGMAGFIVAPERVLLVDANVKGDQGTQWTFKRRQQRLYPAVTASPFNKGQSSLVSQQVRAVQVQQSLKSLGKGYVTMTGHGLGYELFGWYRIPPDTLEVVLSSTGHSLDPAMARDKIFYLFACSCGYGLGKDLVAAGARAFFGYTDRYTILDREWKVFCDCAIAVDLALLAGKTCAEAHGEAIAKYNQEISRFRANQDQNAAKVLERNRNLLVSPVTDRAYGDPNARLETGMATMT